jgi:hypothetical protein
MNPVAQEVRAALAVFCEPGEVHEMRILNTSQATASGYFNDMDKLAEAAAQWDGRGDGVYLTINPTKPELLSRSCNRVKPYAKHTTSDDDIVKRRWLPVDLDPVRPSGISSTDEEHEAALARAEEVVAWLQGQDWPAPIRADSGNGVHGLYRIDLPNTPEATKLVERCLKVLALKFSDSAVKIDVTTSNPARVWKTYGTKSCKGDSTPDRPHRTARLISVPEKVETVPVEMLERLAGLMPEEPRRTASGNGQAFDVKTFIEKAGLEVAFTDAWEGGRKWILKTCPWNSEHTNRSALIMQFPSGAIAARCHHNGCAGKGWQDLRGMFERKGPNGQSRSDGDTKKQNEDDQAREKPDFVTLDAIQRKRVEWLWLNRIPMGRLTLVGGDPEVGKSFLSLKIAAAVSRGEMLPGVGNRPSRPSYVLILSPEDGYGDTVRPRLEDMGADLSKIAVPNPERGFTPNELRVEFVERVVKKIGPALVIIDPVVTFTGKADTSKAWEVREQLSPLMALAERWAFACLMAGHLNKQSGSKAIYRNSGSIDFVAASRSVFPVALDSEQPNRRVLAHVKSSLVSRQPSLSFYIDETGFRWGEEVSMTADELVAPDEAKIRDRRRLEQAKDFLAKALGDGPLPTESIKKRAAGAGIKWATLWRAKDEMGIRARKDQFGPWWWQLTDGDGGEEPNENL